jgi:DNA invertase Pin-like site-specific DNA recombinase
MNDKITADHLRRKAVVYVRQSTTTQLTENRESQRRQYNLGDRARELGFARVETIDDDLGRSGSGCVERPGFQRLVADVCTGDVGAVVSIEASRLARNGRDWHHLIDLCGLVGTLVIDGEGVYDPRVSNDRLLLGLKGTMSEFELNLFRQRSLEALRGKARRGELQFCLPVGFCWTAEGKVELDPDRRVQHAIRTVFRKFTELGSARQVLLWFREEKVSLPAGRTESPASGRKVTWKLPMYKSVLSVLANPFYAGAYAFGKTEARTIVEGGRAHKTHGHRKPRDKWMVLIQGHHPGYISWEDFERNQSTLFENLYAKRNMARKSGRGGRSLLAGLLRCGRCGRMLHVAYSGKQAVPRYHCRGAHVNHGGAWCISFGGLRPDQAVGAEILRAVEGKALDAALEAAEQIARQDADRRAALALELEQARYEAQLASRRYEAVDPAQRLVAAELEARWNVALARVRECEQRFEGVAPVGKNARQVDRPALLALAEDLPAIWDATSTDMRLKQRIAQLLIHEIVTNIDDRTSEIILTIHWSGGRHSELCVPKNKTGRHGRCTTADAVEVVRRMAGQWTDERIASTLNLLGLKTGVGNTWNALRVRSLRSHLGLPACESKPGENSMLTLEEAAEQLRVSPTVVRRLINLKLLDAAQVIEGAPWQISPAALATPAIQQAARDIQARRFVPRSRARDTATLLIPGM